MESPEDETPDGPLSGMPEWQTFIKGLIEAGPGPRSIYLNRRTAGPLLQIIRTLDGETATDGVDGYEPEPEDLAQDEELIESLLVEALRWADDREGHEDSDVQERRALRQGVRAFFYLRPSLRGARIRPVGEEAKKFWPDEAAARFLTPRRIWAFTQYRRAKGEWMGRLPSKTTAQDKKLVAAFASRLVADLNAFFSSEAAIRDYCAKVLGDTSCDAAIERWRAIREEVVVPSDLPISFAAEHAADEQPIVLPATGDGPETDAAETSGNVETLENASLEPVSPSVSTSSVAPDPAEPDTPQERSSARWLRKPISRSAVVLAAAVVVALVLVSVNHWWPGVSQAHSIAKQTSKGDVGGQDVVPASTTWGPGRDTYTIDSPASKPVLNSIVDNPVQGDERNFFQMRAKDDDNSKYVDNLAVTPGKTYVGYLYFENDAASNITEQAEGVRARIEAPGSFTGSSPVNAFLTSSNASPRKVWDGDVLVLPTQKETADFSFVSGSATLHTSGKADGQALSDDIFGDKGALLGCDQIDGVLSGDTRCAGYVTFEFKITQPNFSVTAFARIKGDSSWQQQLTVHPDDQVQIELAYHNTGSETQDNVVLKLGSLSKALRQLPGTTYLKNSTNPDGLHLDQDIGKSGINVGNYAPGGAVYVMFTVMVGDIGTGLADGTQWITLDKVASAVTDNGVKTASLSLVKTDEDAGSDDLTGGSAAASSNGVITADWGPDRPVFKAAGGGAEFAVFDSLTDNTEVGDERDFVVVKRAEDSRDGGWEDTAWGDAGQELQVRIYVDNGAADTVTEAVLRNARLKLALQNQDGTAILQGSLSADNAKTVWDGVTIHMPTGAKLEPVADSLTLYSNSHGDGSKLSGDAFSGNGVLIGDGAQDGTIQPGFSHAQYIYLTLKVVS